MLGGYETENKGEETSSKSLTIAKRYSVKVEGVKKRAGEIQRRATSQAEEPSRGSSEFEDILTFCNSHTRRNHPKKFPMVTMGAYNGMGNLMDHIINYKIFMELKTHSDTLLCKVFPTTLTRAALTWFNNLEAENIKTFRDLINSFMGSS